MLIDDGYTLRATIPSVVHGHIVIEFRPMLRRQRVWLLEGMRANGDQWAWWRADALIAKQCITDSIDLLTGFVRQLRTEEFESWQRVFDLVTNAGNDAQEEADRKNLETGIPLLRKFGHLAGGDTCSLCQQFLFDPERGEFELDDETGERIPRFEEAILACQTHEGCPNGTPDKPLSLSRKNRQAFKHYQECVAVSHFPDDPIVRQNAAIIRSALLRCQRPVNHAPARSVELLVPIYEQPRGSGAGRHGSVPDGSGAGGLDGD